MELFSAVFGVNYSNCVRHMPGLPALVRRLVVARRQTDFVGERWRTSFAGLRHAREAAVRHWANPPAARPPCPASASERRATLSVAPEADTSAGAEVKIYLYRPPGTIPTDGLQVGRDFENIDALGGLLLSRGFVAFEPGLVPLSEIVPLLHHAKQVVSVHGAGLANVLFCPPGTRVCEIVSSWGAWRSLEGLSTVLGHDFTVLKQRSPDAAGEIPRIDLDELIALL
jgi:hypothetical protein